MKQSIGKNEAHNSPQMRAVKRTLHETCKSYGIKHEYLAIRMQRDRTRISRWLNPDETDFPDFDTFNELVSVIKEDTGSIEPLRAITHWHGCDVVNLYQHGEPHIDARTLGRLSSIIASKNGKLCGLLFQILEDGRVSVEGESQLADLEPDLAALEMAIKDLSERVKAAKHAQKVGA